MKIYQRERENAERGKSFAIVVETEDKFRNDFKFESFLPREGNKYPLMKFLISYNFFLNVSSCILQSQRYFAGMKYGRVSRGSVGLPALNSRYGAYKNIGSSYFELLDNIFEIHENRRGKISCKCVLVSLSLSLSAW